MVNQYYFSGIHKTLERRKEKAYSMTTNKFHACNLYSLNIAIAIAYDDVLECCIGACFVFYAPGLRVGRGKVKNPLRKYVK
jgi:hypothetical protein